MKRPWLIMALASSAVARVADGEPATVAPRPVDATMIGDAALADVCFVDPLRGWAVGERGVIWHTEDGGAAWTRQESHVTCRLNSVCFISAGHGWTVGGGSRPYAEATQGVVLRTVDGGQTWIALPAPLLPRLSRVQFFNANDGIAIGDGSSFSPSGVFVTRSGGRDWQPLPAEQPGHWLAGDFLGPEAGAVAGRAGRFATVMRRRVVPSPLAASSLRSFHALRLLPPTSGWLVGDGGQVMTTGDMGRSWQTPAAELPNDVVGQFDFYSLAVRGSHVWIAGAPGSRVFHTGDSGQTWQAFPTRQTAPLRALTFVDETHGWAVGELGSILATQDGGRSWQLQRAGGRRAALLAVFAQSSDVPLEVVAEQAAAEGYLTAVEFLHPDVAHGAATSQTAAGDQTREALVRIGATAVETAWRFPLPPDDLALGPDELLAALNRTNDGRALEQLQRELITQLRMWRPDVVITHHVGPEDRPAEAHYPIAGLVEQLVRRAVDAAGEPSQAVESASTLGLEPWQVKKVYGVLPDGSRGDESVGTGRFSARLGGSLADWSAPSRRLLAAEQSSSPATIELKLLVNRSPGTDGPRGLFRGIPLAPGGEARRPSASDSAGDVDELRRLASRRQILRELMERSVGNAAWVGQVERLVAGVDPISGGELLFQLADGYRDSGRLDLAADTYYLLARQYPDHPLADPALAWLVQFYASSEAAQRTAGGDVLNARPAAVEEATSQNTQVAASAGQNGVSQAAAAMPIGPAAAPVVGLSRDDRLRRAVQLGEYLEASRPLVFAEAAVRFPLVAAQRELGFANPAKRYYLTLGQLPQSDPWRRCAQTEQWLAEPGELPPPKTLGHCRRADRRPHLDGRLDEPFWQSADPLLLRGAEQSADTTDKIVHPTLRLAYDAQFLYLAVSCPKVAGGDYPADDRPRPRDADLTEHDRVSLRLDVDRDFVTWFELVMDHRGWTWDACCGEWHWDPHWFVAAAESETTWTTEAAVPLAELVTEPPAVRHVWAAAVRRTIPRIGYQSWSGDPGQAESPEQFGLLIFE